MGKNNFDEFDELVNKSGINESGRKIKAKDRRVQLRGKYLEGKSEGLTAKPFPENPLKKYSSPEEIPSEERARAVGYANELLEKTSKNGYITDVIAAIQVYESLGMADKKFVGKRVLGVVKDMLDNPEFKKRYKSSAQFAEIYDFFKKHPGNSGNNLEKITGASAIIGIVGGLFFLSTNFTGNAIGSLTKSGANWIGLIFFILGLTLSYVYYKNKN